MEKLKKNKKTFYLVLLIALIILSYFSIKYLTTEFNYQKARKLSNNQFSNIESKIYQIDDKDQKEVTQSNGKINQNAKEIKNQIETLNLSNEEIILRQQIAINQLQQNIYDLQEQLNKIKINDNLPQIILTFIKIKNLADYPDLHQQQIKEKIIDLELLANKDLVLINKIGQLKNTLRNNPKSQIDLINDFITLENKLRDRENEINNQENWSKQVKSTISKFIKIRKIGEIDVESDLENILNQSKKAIINKNYKTAIRALQKLESNYQIIAKNMIFSLQNANDFFEIKGEIYDYLQKLSLNH